MKKAYLAIPPLLAGGVRGRGKTKGTVLLSGLVCSLIIRRYLYKKGKQK